MKKFFKKKHVLLGALVVLPGAAVYLNYYFALQPESLLPTEKSTEQQTEKNLGDARSVSAEPQKQTAEEYFTQARKNREESRKEATELAKEVLKDVKVGDEQKNAATEKILSMAKAIEQEGKIEDLLKVKGYGECIAYIDGQKCSLVVKSEELTAQDTAKISKVVTSQSDVLSQNINIMTVK